MNIVKHVSCCAICPLSHIDEMAEYMNCGVMEGYFPFTEYFDPYSNVHPACPWLNDSSTTLTLTFGVEK